MCVVVVVPRPLMSIGFSKFHILLVRIWLYSSLYSGT
jgi:hypothetical protein